MTPSVWVQPARGRVSACCGCESISILSCGSAPFTRLEMESDHEPQKNHRGHSDGLDARRLCEWRLWRQRSRLEGNARHAGRCSAWRLGRLEYWPWHRPAHRDG